MVENLLRHRSHYLQFFPMVTRWNDNDIYGHINNVVYYSYFDSAVNRFLIEQGQLDIHNSDIVAFVVNSHCEYLEPIAFPEKIEVGISVKKLGNSSVTYSVAIFKSDADHAVACGDFVHVFVDRNTQKSVPIPENIKIALKGLTLAQIT